MSPPEGLPHAKLSVLSGIALLTTELSGSIWSWDSHGHNTVFALWRHHVVITRGVFSSPLTVYCSDRSSPSAWLSTTRQMTEAILLHRHHRAFHLSRVSFGVCCICILLTTVMDMRGQCSDGLDRQQLKLVERARTSLLASFSLCVSILGLSYTNSNTHFTNRSDYEL